MVYYHRIICNSRLLKFVFEPSALLLEDQRCETRSEKHDPQDFLLLFKLITIKKELIRLTHFAADIRACISFEIHTMLENILSN